jgi:hypothetical protein
VLAEDLESDFEDSADAIVAFAEDATLEHEDSGSDAFSQRAFAAKAIAMVEHFGLTTDAAVAADAALDYQPPNSTLTGEPAEGVELLENESEESWGWRRRGGGGGGRGGGPIRHIATHVRAAVHKAAHHVRARVHHVAHHVRARVQHVAHHVRARVQQRATQVRARVQHVAQRIKQHVAKVVQHIKQRVAKVQSAPAPSLPSQEHAALLDIVQYIQKWRERPGQHGASYNGQCIATPILLTMNKNELLLRVQHVPALNALAVVVRGTANNQNLASDFDFWFTPCRFGSLSCGRVHRGMYKLWNDDRAEVMSTINGFLASHPSINTVYAIGHSLGAGVSLFAGLDLAQTFASTGRSHIRVPVVTWGCPRVGDSKWASTFDQFPSLSVVRYVQWRQFLLFRQEDPITLLGPAFMGFSHVGTRVTIHCPQCESWMKVHECDYYSDNTARMLHTRVVSC